MNFGYEIYKNSDDLEENYIKIIDKYKSKVPVRERSVAEVIEWLKKKVDVEEISSDEISKQYNIRNKMFLYNCKDITNKEDFLVKVFRVFRNEKSYKYYEECFDEELLLWLEETNFIIDTTSNLLYRELMIYKGISEYDYVNDTIKLSEYISIYFDLSSKESCANSMISIAESKEL